MAAVGGMLAAAILKVVGDQIGSVIGGQIKLQKNLDEDLNGMKMTLESIEAVLKVGGRQSIVDEQTRLWLKRLTVAMYDISSLIDKFEDDTQAITEHSVLKEMIWAYGLYSYHIWEGAPGFRGPGAAAPPAPPSGPGLDQCWAIIMQKSDFKSRYDQEELQHIGMDIASKCGGVALAAQTIGHMLHSLPFDEWESVRNSDFWNLSDPDDTDLTHVLPSLKLSYSVMPSYLQICFAYCAIFPKGYKIVKDDLIHQWISLGFIKADTKSSTWQLGEKCIRQLLGLSFLEHSKSALTTGVNFENDTLLTMHDLVHDLARLVMVDEVLVAGKQGNSAGRCWNFALLNEVMVAEIVINSKQGNSGGSCCHFASLNDRRMQLELSKIRALRFMECTEIELHGVVFSSAKSMRVLDLSECSILKLSGSISVLKQLRYLNAPRVQDAKIPDSITKLSKLIYLNLHGSPKILALPESIGEIEGLMYLDFSGCSGIAKLPESFGRLKELVHLDLSNCSCVRGISVFFRNLTELQYLDLSYCPNIGEIPKTLGGLSKLKYLNLSFSSYIKDCIEAVFLCALTKLEYLNLSSDYCYLQKLPEALGRFTQLKYLNLSGCLHMEKLPKLFGNLKNLVHLDLSNCWQVNHLHESLVHLTNLQYLNLKKTCLISLPEDLKKIRYLNLSELRKMQDQSFDSLINHISSHLSDLEHLDLSNNISIRSIPESLCSLRKLHTLDLSRCIFLQKVPQSIYTMASLRFLYLKSLVPDFELPQLGGSAVSLPHFPVHAVSDESSSNLFKLQPTDPVELQITKLENVKSAEEAHHIKLTEKHSLEKLKLEWTQDVERFVDDKMLLEKLVPPRTLKKLEICGYNSVSFPPWLVGQLPNLESLDLTGMTNLEEWNMSCSNCEEHVFEELRIHDCPMLRMTQPLPKAKFWYVHCSDNVLSSLDECTVSHTNASSNSSPITTTLSIKGCKGPHQWRLLQHFPGLSYLCIDNCGDLNGSAKIAQYLSYLETLCLEDEHMEELPKWLGELTSLQKLQITGSDGVKEFNENMRQLTMLQSLELSSCHNLSLPHWLGELTSLKLLQISCNTVLRSLPESIQQLTSLKDISIGGCPALEHVVSEPEEGRRKLTHNQERACALPTSLSDLHIYKCEGIKCLPEGIQQLTNLDTLTIKDCPELEQWCKVEENMKKLSHIKLQHIGFRRVINMQDYAQALSNLWS